MKDRYYFPHYYNSRYSDELIQLAEDHKLAGYGLYWIIMEAMHEDEDSGMDYDDRQIGKLARRYGMPEDTIMQIIDDCIHVYDLFYEKNGRILSTTVTENKLRRKKGSDTCATNGRKGGLAKAANRKAKMKSEEEIEEEIEDEIEDESLGGGGSVALSTKERKEREESKETVLKTNVFVENEVSTVGDSLQQPGSGDNGTEHGTDTQTPQKPKVCRHYKRPIPPLMKPYMDDWNRWAAEYGMPRITTITDCRRNKLKTRMKEPEFDMQHLLDMATRSTAILESNWFTFDWLIKSVHNYQRLSEGAYTDKQVPERRETERRAQEADRHESLLAASRAFINS